MASMTKFKKWMKRAVEAEQRKLAKAAGVSHSYLFHLANGYRIASANTAGKIEIMAAKLRSKSKNRLPKITRGDICPACAKCPYFKKCKK